MDKPFRSKRDIIETLHKIDYDLGKLSTVGRVSLIIFGGSALLLKSNLHVTSDIDAFVRMEKEDEEIRRILARWHKRKGG